jgi:hypothetical protein
MSRRQAAAASRTTSGVRAVPPIWSCNGTNRTSHPPFDSGCAAASLAITADSRACAAAADTPGQMPDDVQTAASAGLSRVRGDDTRYPDVNVPAGRKFEPEPGGQNTDYRGRRAAQGNSPSDELRIAAETAHPQPVADQGCWRRVGPLLVARERAPHHRTDAEHLEEID